MIIPKYGEYNYYHEAESKPELIIFWVRDIVAVYKRETQLIIESGDIDISEINRIDIVVGGDHGRGSFRVPMKILHIKNNGKRYESIPSVGCILCKQGNGIILKKTIIKDVGYYFKLLNESMTFNNQYTSPSNIYVTGVLAFLVILLGGTCVSSLVYKCKSPSKYQKLSDHFMSDEQTIETLKVMSQSGGNAEFVRVKEEPYWDFIQVDKFICPILHNQINLGIDFL